ncbi:MAG: hypothetical protein AAB950_00525 [Patescibacteria group bacterium]
MKKWFRNILGFLAVLFLGFAVFFAVEQYRYYKSPQHKAEKYFNDLREKYEADTYGGSTPEETLQLFVDALKKGDVDLASKYFMVEEQEKEKTYLQEMKDKGLLASVIENINKLELTKNNGKEAFFVLANKMNVVEIQVILQKISNRWKISEL